MMVIDWSDTGECHEQTGVHRTSGRIYKVIYEGNVKQGTAARSGEPQLARSPLSCSSFNRHGKPIRAGTLTQSSMRKMLDEEDEHLRVWGIWSLTDQWPRAPPWDQ